jgi:SsrA-binding protein
MATKVSKAKEQKTSKEKMIAKNKRAFHDYEVLETFEAGIALTGTEVRSLRDNNGQLTESFVIVRGGEAYLVGFHIKAFLHGGHANVDPDRRRKLLLHKKQIRYFLEQTKIKGLAIVPLKIYFNKDGRVKLEIAIARGKKLYDKRQAMAKRDADRDAARALSVRS